jgi:hypothetical protein
LAADKMALVVVGLAQHDQVRERVVATRLDTDDVVNLDALGLAAARDLAASPSSAKRGGPGPLIAA